MKKNITILLIFLMILTSAGCHSKIEEKSIDEETQKEISYADSYQEDLAKEESNQVNNSQKEDKQNDINLSSNDYSNTFYCVIFYDQYGNELQKETLKYGTIPKYKKDLPKGFEKWINKLTQEDVAYFNSITGNTYYQAVCHDIPEPKNKSKHNHVPSPEPVEDSKCLNNGKTLYYIYAEDGDYFLTSKFTYIDSNYVYEKSSVAFPKIDILNINDWFHYDEIDENIIICDKNGDGAELPTYSTVTLHTNGLDALNEPTILKTANNETLLIPQTSFITADDRTVQGWYKDPACTNQWDFDFDVVTDDTTLYSKWSPAPEQIKEIDTIEKNGVVYNKIEYIKTSGTQYINTGYKYKGTDKIYIEVSIDALGDGYTSPICGSYQPLSYGKSRTIQYHIKTTTTTSQGEIELWMYYKDTEYVTVPTNLLHYYGRKTALKWGYDSIQNGLMSSLNYSFTWPHSDLLPEPKYQDKKYFVDDFECDYDAYILACNNEGTPDIGENSIMTCYKYQVFSKDDVLIQNLVI